jgi:hypothetical protein
MFQACILCLSVNFRTRRRELGLSQVTVQVTVDRVLRIMEKLCLP